MRVVPRRQTGAAESARGGGPHLLQVIDAFGVARVEVHGLRYGLVQHE